MFWLWVGFAIVLCPPFVYGLGLATLHLYVRWKYNVDFVSAVRLLFHRND